MKEKIKENISYYNMYFKHGTLAFIGAIILRIALFPVMLLYKLYKWVYEI